MLTHSKLSFEW